MIIILAAAVMLTQAIATVPPAAISANENAVRTFLGQIEHGEVMDDPSTVLSIKVLHVTEEGPPFNRQVVPSSMEYFRSFVDSCRAEIFMRNIHYKVLARTDFPVRWTCEDGSRRFGTISAFDGQIHSIYWGKAVMLAPPMPGQADEGVIELALKPEFVRNAE